MNFARPLDDMEITCPQFKGICVYSSGVAVIHGVLCGMLLFAPRPSKPRETIERDSIIRFLLLCLTLTMSKTCGTLIHSDA